MSLIFICFCVQINLAQDLLNSPLLSEDPINQKRWVDSLYNAMSIDEKIGQLYMVQVYSNKGKAHKDAIIKLIKNK